MTNILSKDYNLIHCEEELSIGIRLDSDSKIYKFDYSTSDANLKALLSTLDIVNRPIEILLSSCELKDKYLKINSESSNQLLLVLRSMYNKFIHSNLSKKMFLELSDRLVCRCMGISEKDLDLAFKNNQADRVKAIKETNASMGCSSCRDEVMSFFDNHFLNKADDQSVKILNKINKNLEEFNLHSTLELSDYIFVAVSVKNAQVKVKAIKGKVNVPRPQITKTLENYLGEKLLNGLTISVFY